MNSNNSNYTVNYKFNYQNPEWDQSGKIIIVGTAHVSEKSIAEVNEIIERERPDIVAVELCQKRYDALTEKAEVKEIPVKDMLSQGRFYYFLLQWLLAYVQKKIGADMGVKPGAEMLSAIKKAEEIGAKVALVDRDIQVTLQRFWNKMSFLEKLKLFWSLVLASFGFGKEEIDINTVTNEDVVSQLINELRQFAPSAAVVLIDERDAYIAANLIDASKNGKVVAVVGAGHKEGIKKYLEMPETIPKIEELAKIPKKRFSLVKIATYSIIAMVVGLIGLLLFTGAISITAFLTALFYLFLTQGIFSAIGVIIARGHPYSAMTAFSLAWFGFLHPFLAIGWIAGLVEATVRPPIADDFRKLMDAQSFTELINNRVFKIILVAALANLGSMIGTFVAIPFIVKYLGITNPLTLLKDAMATALRLIGI